MKAKKILQNYNYNKRDIGNMEIINKIIIILKILYNNRIMIIIYNKLLIQNNKKYKKNNILIIVIIIIICKQYNNNNNNNNNNIHFYLRQGVCILSHKMEVIIVYIRCKYRNVNFHI